MRLVYTICNWTQRLRDIALNEEVKINTSDVALTPTLLGLTSSLSRSVPYFSFIVFSGAVFSEYKIDSFFPFASFCSGAEYLLQVVRGAIPRAYFESSSAISAAEVAVHLLDYLYKKLDQVCLVQGGEVVAFSFSLFIFSPCCC